MRGRTLKEYVAEQMKDPEFQVLKAMIKAREKSGISQAELARRLVLKLEHKKVKTSS